MPQDSGKFRSGSSFSQVGGFIFEIVMAMTLSFHENLDYADAAQSFEVIPTAANYSSAGSDRIHLFADKMRVPEFKNFIPRPRLTELLEKSAKQFGATLVTGRAATGKSALAAEFSARFDRVAWYQIDTAETDWPLFARYFTAIFGEDFDELKEASWEIVLFLEKLLAKVAGQSGERILIVLDDIHNVFDAGWFSEFFASLLYALTPEMNLLMLSRTKPPQPLWRARSKQVLNVIDEKLLAFNLDETAQLFKSHGLKRKQSEIAHKKTFGRVSRLQQFIEAA